MDLPQIVREVVENATLVWLFSFFVGMVIFIFRPGSRAVHDDAAQVPLRERESLTCPNACPACACAGLPDFIGDAK